MMEGQSGSIEVGFSGGEGKGWLGVFFSFIAFFLFF